MDERYIGLAIAISGSFAIGTSIILTKKVRAFPMLTRQRDLSMYTTGPYGGEPGRRLDGRGKVVG
jgi:hypothetical protein